MKIKIWICLIVILVGLLTALIPFHGSAQNPIIQTKYTADPAPMVYNDTVFLYTGHDEDNAFGFNMKDWLLYTSTDMVNWTDHGVVASLKDFKWVRFAFFSTSYFTVTPLMFSVSIVNRSLVGCVPVLIFV